MTDTTAAASARPDENGEPSNEDRQVGNDLVTRAARGTALNLAGAVVGAVVSFMTVGLITNAYGNAGAGLFFAATAAFTLAANAARLGAESSLTYFISRFRTDDRHASIPAVVRTGLQATATAAVVLAAIGFVVAEPLSRSLTSEIRSAETVATMIRILALAVPTFTLSQSMFGASRGFGTMRPSVVVGQIVRPVSQLVLVVVVMATTDQVWPLALAWALSSGLTMLSIGAWLRGRLTRAAANRNRPGPGRPTAGSIRSGEYWRFSGPRALSDLLSAALERLDVLLVAVFVGEVGAGLYGASNRLILAGQLLMIATAQAMAPLLSANFGTGRGREAEKVLRTVSGWNVILLWPLFIGLAFGARTALSVFGPEFTAASSLVVVLSLAFLVITGLGIGDTLLMMTGDSVASLINHAIALAVMIGTAVTLLPAVGIVGAAWAWALSRVVLRALAVARVRQTHGVHALGLPVITAALVTSVAYVPTGIAARVLYGQTLMAVVFHIVAGTIIQLALLVRFRRQLDLDQLVAVVTGGPRGRAQPSQS